MVTGHWPFNADTPERIAAKRLSEAPVPPVRYVPKLEPVWNRAILRCLERNPESRYSSAVDAIDEIKGHPRLRARITVASIGLILCCGVGFLLARHNEIGPFRSKPQIAVLGWRNRSGNPDFEWIARELSERLSYNLRQSTSDAVVPQEDVDSAEIEFSVPTNRDLDKEDLNQFRAALGANSFVVGSYETDGKHLTIDGILRVQRVGPSTVFMNQVLLTTSLTW